MRNKPTIQRRTLTNLLIDIAIFIAFLLATAPRLTGIAIHEWLSIAFGAAIITHLLLHWSWIVGITKQFFRRANAGSRLSYVLNILLFIDTTVIIATGLLISQEVLPLFGLHLAGEGIWRRLHSLSSDFGVFIVGLHTALHWRWIVSTIGRLGGRLVGSGRPAPVERISQATAQTTRQEVRS